MKHQLLEDLLRHLSADPVERGWNDERDRLLKEVQAERDAIIPYQSSIGYKLQRQLVTGEVVIVKNGKEKRVQTEHIERIGKITDNVQVARGIVREAMKTYPLGELRLYHGSRRIWDIEGWLAEQEANEQS